MDWYKNFALEFLEGTAQYNNTEVGIYKRLLDHQWCRKGYLPANVAVLAELVNIHPEDEPQHVMLRRVLREKFRLHKRGYTNLKLLRMWREAVKLAEKRRLAGKASGRARAEHVLNKSSTTRARARRASSSISKSVGGKEGCGKPSGGEQEPKYCDGVPLNDAAKDEMWGPGWRGKDE